MKRSMRFSWVFATISCCGWLVSSSSGALDLGSPTGQAHGYWFSIDGLRGDHLDEMVKNGELTAPHGFKWLSRTALRVKKAWPVEITLTAPSHVSTITCSYPSQHGITANSFLVGDQKVSGFKHPIATETLWQAAKRQGRKVISIAYVGADGASPERTPDIGISYPDDKLMSKPQSIHLDFATLPPATGWVLSPAMGELSQYVETQANVVLNPVTSETVVLNFLFLVGPTGLSGVWFDTDKDSSNGGFEALDVTRPATVFGDAYFVEADPLSGLFGRKRRIYSTIVQSNPTGVDLYISAPTYNLAYPEEFARRLDAQNLVWPDYAVSTNVRSLSPMEYVASLSITDRFLADVAVAATTWYPHDIVLFYQPLIDSMGHKYEAEFTSPLNHNSSSEPTRAYVEAFKIVDQNISRVLRSVKRHDTIVLMGDHGMEPIKKQINIAALVPGLPADRIVVSGAQVLVYPSPTINTEQLGSELGVQLGQLTGADGVSVGGQVHNRLRLGAQESWQYGEAIWAFTAGSGYWYTMNPIATDVFLPPPITGMHGHGLEVANMATTFFLKGVGIPVVTLRSISLIDVAPTFSELLGMKPPRDCRGMSLIPRVHL